MAAAVVSWLYPPELDQRSSDLQRDQRVAARSVRQPHQRGSREVSVQPGGEQVMECGEAQRREIEDHGWNGGHPLKRIG